MEMIHSFPINYVNERSSQHSDPDPEKYQRVLQAMLKAHDGK
jgi:hypothetical protein